MRAGLPALRDFHLRLSIEIPALFLLGGGSVWALQAVSVDRPWWEGPLLTVVGVGVSAPHFLINKVCEMFIHP